VQTTDENYDKKARAQCKKYIELLERVYERENKAPLPDSVSLKVAVNNHDFGTYYTVAVTCDEFDETAMDAVAWLDSNAPERWED
jgi:hypothetical protein